MSNTITFAWVKPITYKVEGISPRGRPKKTWWIVLRMTWKV